ncbi:LuxR C-terminal-related transcriptional regulator [Amycolatopsis sp. NPDC059027]|uniref:helix-turn-helix transcriptional regulator n=1 Tax=unclassified Amycolatopsis TaxID=2618356 RepID=UPI0036720987
MELIRVKVYATDPITQSGVKAGLRPRPRMSVVDGGETGPVDVVVVAVERLSAEAMRLLRAAATEDGAPIVLVTNEIKEADLLPALECRVVAIVSRAAACEEKLARAVVSAASGGADLPADLLGHLLEQTERLHREVLESRGMTASGLSSREIHVLRLMADGLDTHEIGKELGYSERTVKNIIYALTTRIQLRNRPHAVAYAMRAGVI